VTVSVKETSTGHPLAALTPEEITAAVAVVHGDHRWHDDWRFAYVGLEEPTKASVRGYTPGDQVDRLVHLTVVAGPEAHVTEIVVSVTTGEVRSFVEVEGMRPGLLFEESLHAILALKEDPQWQAAMRRRGIEDLDSVQIDPWPAGSFDIAHETGRRICRCLCYLREEPHDNGYAKPIEGVIGFVDMARGQVLEIVDTGVVPLPPE
jgi:primary-amine oxidase